MIPSKFVTVLLLLAAFTSLKAVETVPYPSGTPYYNTADNISNTVSGWSSGWGSGNTNDGWNYVGQLLAPNGLTCSGVYLGNGWVLTVGHVGAGSFTLGGYVYNANGIVATGQPDLSLFQISTISTTGHQITLPPLTLTSASDATNLLSSQIVMIGNGGGKSWGVNTITSTNQLVQVTDNGVTYLTYDYITADGSNAPGGVTNNAQLVAGDSGGGNFVKINGVWKLAGLNEAVDGGTGNSYMVQLSVYNASIQSIMASVPEPSTLALLALSLSAFSFSIWRRQRNS